MVVYVPTVPDDSADWSEWVLNEAAASEVSTKQEGGVNIGLIHESCTVGQPDTDNSIL